MKASLLDVNDINRLFHMVRILLLKITLSKLYPRQGLQTPSLIIFSWLRMALCRNIEGFLSILKKKKNLLRISTLCQNKGIINNVIPTWQRTGHTGTSVLPQFTKSKCFPRACTDDEGRVL